MFVYQKKKIKRILIILSIILSAIIFFICFMFIYNEIIKPFEHKTYYKGKDKNSDSIMEIPFYDKYVKNNFDQYSCMVFTRYGKNSILPYYTLLFDNYTLESYSIIIDLNDDYYDMIYKSVIDIEFVKTKVGTKESSHYVDVVEINEWTFKEIKYGYEWYEENDLMENYYEDFRKISYWYGFNDSTNQISFSILNHYDIGVYLDDNDLIKYFKKNLPL